MSKASSSALAASRRAVRCAGEIPAVGGEAGGGCGLALWRAFLGPQRFREATEARTRGLAANFTNLTFFFFARSDISFNYFVFVIFFFFFFFLFFFTLLFFVFCFFPSFSF
jgi:hypothetical protein